MKSKFKLNALENYCAGTVQIVSKHRAGEQRNSAINPKHVHSSWRNPYQKRILGKNGSDRETFFSILSVSEIEVFGLTPGSKQTEKIAEFKNCNGALTVLWSLVCWNELNKGADYWLKEDAREFWEIPSNKSLPEGIRALVTLTQSSNLYVSSDNFKRMAMHIREFLNKAGDDFQTNHWSAILQVLESEASFKAIGFNWLSYEHNFWSGSDIDDWDCDSDDSCMDELDSEPDWTKAKELFAYLKELDEI